jgi:hypothetical protein
MVAISDVVESIKTPVREIIGRVSRTVQIWRGTVSIDRTQTDFFFWDRFRRGMLDGGRLAGLFAKPASEIKADWVIGDGFQVALATEEQSEAVSYTNSVIKRFVGRVKSTFLTMTTDYYALGNQYVIVNPDGSLSIPSPETVTMEYDVLDYRQPVKATVKTKYEKFTVSDEYRLDGRTISIETPDALFREQLLRDGWQATSKASIVEQGYDNLIGRLPVVHFANDRSANETSGRPMYEPLLSLFQRYDAALEKALDAAEIMANPIPVFEGMEDVQETIAQNSDTTNEQYQNSNGGYVDRVRIAFDRFATIIIGKGGRFTFASPTKGYTDDVKSMLKLLFLLVLENLRIPEVVWGGGGRSDGRRLSPRRGEEASKARRGEGGGLGRFEGEHIPPGGPCVGAGQPDHPLARVFVRASDGLVHKGIDVRGGNAFAEQERDAEFVVEPPPPPIRHRRQRPLDPIHPCPHLPRRPHRLAAPRHRHARTERIR